MAVVDDGVDSHEDLPASRVLDGYDYADNDSNARPGDTTAHGMGCSGIIASSHTTNSDSSGMSVTGVFSMAPETSVLPVKIFHDDGSGTGVSAATIAAAITYAWQSGAEVLSNSWGYGFPWLSYDVLNDALERASLFGRNNRGCPVIFSSGNDDSVFNGVSYPAGQPSVLAVGATQLDDYRWYYSQYGPTLDLVAPSGDYCLQGDVWTLDQMSGLGYNPNVTSRCGMSITWNCPSGSNDPDYDCHFGGTSAACPLVSGTASLVLARDSTLTALEVHTILCSSAVKNLDWGALPDTPSVEYGWGRVDAFRAILSISRGDANNDYTVDMSDLVWLVDYMFTGGPAPFPSELLADMDCSGDVDNSDLVYLADYMFTGGPLPIKPCFEF